MTGFGMWWIFPVIILLFMIVLMAIMMSRRGGVGPWQDPGGRAGENRGSETALEILRKRYARGEITREEFEQLRDDLDR